MSTPTAENTAGRVINRLRSKLIPLYGRVEANSMIRIMFESVMGWSQTDMLINEDRVLSSYSLEKLDEIERRLLAHEPIQYITGLAYFYGMDFEVEPGILIPRPETAELVDMIVRENKAPDLQVADIGTGSGCIAIALSRNLTFPQITAIDISPIAIEVAQRNARRMHACNIKFIHADIFSWIPEAGKYDIFVSNPPYVDDSERSDMERNVLDYEPAEALFVSDSEPLLYYKRIVLLAKRGLRPGGKLYFEINPRHADDMEQLVEREGFTNVAIHNDTFGKKRILSCSLPSERD
ncbi:MAG: peptide chain release factor N(5)-glutamine methyltransferase [Bacteroidales bacterium]|nr:peptide chain release factor N(5)-glutamine methyltransferase [Bacteroidales bacterium]